MVVKQVKQFYCSCFNKTLNFSLSFFMIYFESSLCLCFHFICTLHVRHRQRIVAVFNFFISCFDIFVLSFSFCLHSLSSRFHLWWEKEQRTVNVINYSKSLASGYSVSLYPLTAKHIFLCKRDEFVCILWLSILREYMWPWFFWTKIERQKVVYPVQKTETMHKNWKLRTYYVFL